MPSLTFLNKFLLCILSLLIVGFGQPIWGWLIGFIAAAAGFTLFWRVLLDIPGSKKRFWLGTAWFFMVQCIQLFWMTYHPFTYIYLVYFLLAFLVGLQFGVLCLWIKPKFFDYWIPLLGLSGFWTLMEWSRLSFLSGYSWNPVGLALASNIYTLQTASLAGIFGMSFYVILMNLIALKIWINQEKKSASLCYLLGLCLPLLFGYTQIQLHTEAKSKSEKVRALLVQTAFPAEESMEFPSLSHYAAFVLEEWKQILAMTKESIHEKVDLVALPEYVVPFGTYSFVYPYEVVVQAFIDAYGPSVVDKLPAKELPLVHFTGKTNQKIWAVNNAFWAQALANIHEAPLISGLEDAEDVNNKRERYSAAIYFQPMKTNEKTPFQTQRYAKQVLVPMAEYIPFSFCRQLAAQYGITGSFTCGDGAEILMAGKIPFGVSICYEETFGNLICESRQKGAELLVNLTSDVWFPNSSLPYQHLEHSRLRTVENGIPLLRACNTGITCAIDSFGELVSIFGHTQEEQEWGSGCLVAEVSTYHYQTLYSRFGDQLIIIIALGFSLLWTGFSLLKIDPLF